MVKLETERLVLKEIRREDFDDIYEILSDIEIMYAWGRSFTEDEAREWIEKNIMRYERDGYSYLTAREKATGECIGLIGPLREEIEGRAYEGAAYIVDKKYWGMGYALEGARASVKYLLEEREAAEVVAVIKEDNLSSRRVAEGIGMKYRYTFIREFDGERMPHMVYSVRRKN